MILYQQILTTPLGNMIAITSQDAVYSLRFEDSQPYQWRQSVEIIEQETKIHQQLHQQLKDYFAKKIEKFSIPIKLLGTTFQNEVWHHLMKIDYSETLTYQQLACQLEGKACARAVGTAVAKNPIYLLVPCHRIIRSDGKLGEYGGNKRRKKILYELEQG